jgi:hypothetical protein
MKMIFQVALNVYSPTVWAMQQDHVLLQRLALAHLPSGGCALILNDTNNHAPANPIQPAPGRFRQLGARIGA